jgi:hypothetical protein
MILSLFGKVCSCVAILAAFFSFVLGLAGSIQAESISFPANNSIPLLLTDWTDQPMAFPMFEPKLGTLTSVEFTFSGDIFSFYDLFYKSPSIFDTRTFPIAFYTETTFSFQDVGGVLNTVAFNVDTHYIQTEIRGWGGFGNGPDFSESWMGPVGGVQYFDPAALEVFSGNGNVAMNVSASSRLVIDFNQPGTLEQTLNVRADLNGSITYIYNAIPEPGEFTLLSTLFLVIVTLRSCRIFSLRRTINSD